MAWPSVGWWGASVAQPRLRQPRIPPQTVPNPRTPPTTSPPCRWGFPRLEGLHRVRGRGQGQVPDLSEGLHDVPSTVLRLFSERVGSLDQISPGERCSMSGTGTVRALAA